MFRKNLGKAVINNASSVRKDKMASVGIFSGTHTKHNEADLLDECRLLRWRTMYISMSRWNEDVKLIFFLCYNKWRKNNKYINEQMIFKRLNTLKQNFFAKFKIFQSIINFKVCIKIQKIETWYLYINELICTFIQRYFLWC